MYLYLKSPNPVLKITVINTFKFEFSKSWDFTYKAMAYYAAENGNNSCTFFDKLINFTTTRTCTSNHWLIIVRINFFYITSFFVTLTF